MLRLSVEVRGTLYLAAFVSVVAAVALAVRRLDPFIGVELPKWLVPCGSLLVVVGAVLGLACVLLFVVAGRGTPVPLDPPRRFVAVGPYRYVRNPMYVGGLGILVGTGLWLGSAAILLLAIVLFLVVQSFIVFVEEPGLEQRFGESYLEYKRQVRRWRPRFRPRP